MRCLLILALLILSEMAMAAPRRAVSLNLCTDEYLLAVARPGQIRSLSHLGHDPQESRWAERARPYHRNAGTIDSVATQRPDLIVTMGAAPEDRAELARTLGARLLVLPYPQRLDDVTANLATLAKALGHPESANAWTARIARIRATSPAKTIDATYLTSEGLTIMPHGLGARWMRLAGLRQKSFAGDRLNSEQLLTMKHGVILHSRYRPGQMARSQQWSGLNLIRNRPGWRVIDTDGRGWLCGGPPMISEIIRLRKQVAG